MAAAGKIAGPTRRRLKSPLQAEARATRIIQYGIVDQILVCFHGSISTPSLPRRFTGNCMNSYVLRFLAGGWYAGNGFRLLGNWLSPLD